MDGRLAGRVPAGLSWPSGVTSLSGGALPCSVALDGGLDAPVGLDRDPVDLPVVVQAERGEVVEEVVLVGQDEPDPLDLLESLQNGLAHAPDGVLHRRAEVVGEGAADLL